LARGIDRAEDIYIKISKIVAVPEGDSPTRRKKLMLPPPCSYGADRPHTHLNRIYSDLGIRPDTMIFQTASSRPQMLALPEAPLRALSAGSRNCNSNAGE